MRLTLLLIVSLLATACGTREYTSDATSESRAQSVVGRCFELRRDVTFTPDPTAKALEGAANPVLRYDGFIYVSPDATQMPANGVRVRAGARFVVERVIAEHLAMVGTVLKPYVRFGADYRDVLVQASALFEFNADNEMIKPLLVYLRACG